MLSQPASLSVRPFVSSIVSLTVALALALALLCIASVCLVLVRFGLVSSEAIALICSTSSSNCLQLTVVATVLVAFYWLLLLLIAMSRQFDLCKNIHTTPFRLLWIYIRNFIWLAMNF